MDPFSIAAGIGGLVGTAYTVGKALYDLCDGISLASREFEVFSQEVNHFASVWSLVQPRLENSPAVLTDACLTTVDRVLTDTGKIVRDLRDSVESFRYEYEQIRKSSYHAFIKVAQTAAGRSEKAIREKKLKKFLNRGTITLQRSQLHYATTVLNIVLATIDHAHNPSPQQRSAVHANTEEFLFYEEQKARTRLREDERETVSIVSASHWVREMPAGPRGQFDALARRWTKPIPQELRQSYSRVPGLREYVQSIKQDSDEAVIRLQRNIDEQRRSDQAVIADLQRTVEKLREDGQQQSHEMEDRIEKLMGEIRGYQHRLRSLEDECHRYRTERDAARASAASAELSSTRLQQIYADLKRDHDQERERSERRRKERDTAERNLRDLQAQANSSRKDASQLRRDLGEMQRRYREAIATRDDIQAEYATLKNDLRSAPSSWRSSRRPSYSSGSSRTYVEREKSSVNKRSRSSVQSARTEDRYSDSDDDDAYNSASGSDYGRGRTSDSYHRPSTTQRYEDKERRSQYNSYKPSTHGTSARRDAEWESRPKGSTHYRRS